MSKWKYLGGELGEADLTKRPCVAKLDMVLGTLVATIIREKGFFAPLEYARISTLSEEIEAIYPLEASRSTDKGAVALYAGAGMALLGPLGVLAAAAAKKKDEIAFVVKVSEGASDTNAKGKTFAALTTRKNYDRLLRNTGLAAKSISRAIQDISSSVLDPDSVASDLERLAKLREDGLLTEEEYSSAKSKVLGLT